VRKKSQVKKKEKKRVLILSTNLSRHLKNREADTVGRMGLELHPTGTNKRWIHLHVAGSRSSSL
jgi:hypothetical protein